MVMGGDTDDVDNVVRKLAGVVCSEVVTTGFDQEKLGIEFRVEVLKSLQVGTDILTDWGVAGFVVSCDHKF